MKQHELNHTRVADYALEKVNTLMFNIRESTQDILWLTEKTCSELKEHLLLAVPKLHINESYTGSEMVPIIEVLENVMLTMFGSIGKTKSINYHGLTCNIPAM